MRFFLFVSELCLYTDRCSLIAPFARCVIRNTCYFFSPYFIYPHHKIETFNIYNEELNLASYEIKIISYLLPITIKFIQHNATARKELFPLLHELKKFRRLRIRSKQLDLHKTTSWTTTILST